MCETLLFQSPPNSNDYNQSFTLQKSMKGCIYLFSRSHQHRIPVSIKVYRIPYKDLSKATLLISIEIFHAPVIVEKSKTAVIVSIPKTTSLYQKLFYLYASLYGRLPVAKVQLYLFFRDLVSHPAHSKTTVSLQTVRVNVFI